MNRCLAALLFAIFFWSNASAQQQSTPAPAPAGGPSRNDQVVAPDFSQEPFIIERYLLSARFENDGTGERTLSSRIKVQSDAGVQQLGELIFGYNTASEKMDVHFVRVLKPDGST